MTIAIIIIIIIIIIIVKKLLCMYGGNIHFSGVISDSLIVAVFAYKRYFKPYAGMIVACLLS